MSGLVIIRFSARTSHDEGQNTTFAMDDRLLGYTCPSDWSYACLEVEAFSFCFFSNLLIPQSSAVKEDLDLAIKMLPDLHFAPPQGSSRLIDQKLTVFPLGGISIGCSGDHSQPDHSIAVEP